MHGKIGTLTKSEEQIMEVWAEHLESLGTPEAHPLQYSQFGERVSIQNAHCALLSPLLPQVEKYALDGLFDERRDRGQYHCRTASIEALAYGRHPGIGVLPGAG